MKKHLLINCCTLFIILFLLLIQISSLFELKLDTTMYLIFAFAILSIMSILIFMLNIVFNLVLHYLTSFNLDYESNKEKVLVTIFLVSQVVFVVIYIITLYDKMLIIELQKYKYITPIIYSFIFSMILGLNKKDILRFNLGIVGINVIIFFSEKILIRIF